MEYIKQTNKTILFDEINSEKMDILTLINDDNIDSLDDDKIKEINEHLLVNSFDEFLVKFDPKIYSYYDSDKKCIDYILEKPLNVPDSLIKEIKIDNGNTFFKMLNTLLETRKSQGIRNVDFKFESILEFISPKKVIEDIKQIRKEINYLFKKYESLEEENPKKLELGDKLNIKFEEASKNYNNILGMLPLAIEDIKTRLLLQNNNGSDEIQKIKIGMLQVGTRGELEVIEYEEADENKALLLETKYNNELAITFKEDYESISDEPNKYISDLVVRTFVPLSNGITEVDTSQEVENYNNYLEFYKMAQNNFIKVAKPLIEKLLGIKLYFDQYQTKNSKMKPSLLITNIKSEQLIKSNNKKKLEAYLNTVNTKNDFSNTIWFGIFPNVQLNESKNKRNIRERFKGNKKSNETEKNSLEVLSNLMGTLKKYKIQVFFNFEANEETTFSDLSKTGIKKYVEKTEILENQIYSEYLIPVIPNFTIIPKDKSGVKLDYKMIYYEENDSIKLSESKEDLYKFWIDGVYVDGSYIAAGIISALQCPNYLKDRFKNVSSQYPGVRFDIEQEDNSYQVKTTMSKEISGFTNNIKDSINQYNYGFIFASESVQINREMINNIFVYKARSLLKNQDGMYESIYKTMTATYIERILRYMTTDFKEDKLQLFFSSNPQSQKSIWTKDQKFINCIIQKGDDISHTIDKINNICQLNIVFSGNVKNLQVEINKN